MQEHIFDKLGLLVLVVVVAAMNFEQNFFGPNEKSLVLERPFATGFIACQRSFTQSSQDWMISVQVLPACKPGHRFEIPASISFARPVPC